MIAQHQAQLCTVPSQQHEGIKVAMQVQLLQMRMSPCPMQPKAEQATPRNSHLEAAAAADAMGVQIPAPALPVAATEEAAEEAAEEAEDTKKQKGQEEQIPEVVEIERPGGPAPASIPSNALGKHSRVL